jgi:hypothetical protein
MQEFSTLTLEKAESLKARKMIQRLWTNPTVKPSRFQVRRKHGKQNTSPRGFKNVQLHPKERMNKCDSGSKGRYIRVKDNLNIFEC